MQDAELAAVLQLLQTMWNKDYQVCSDTQPLSHVRSIINSLATLAIAAVDNHLEHCC